MFIRSLSFGLLLAAYVGCGKEPAPADNSGAPSVIPTANAPTVSDEAAAPVEPTAPTSPPGKIEMPKDAVPPVPNDAPGASESGTSKGGGFEMPAADSGAPPVVVQRPVLDEVPTPANVELKLATLETIREKATTSNKVTIVDFWSLSCEPCLKEFPGLVKLHRELGDRISCISVDVDFDGRKSKPAESYRPRVEAFLSSVDAEFTHFLCETPNEEVFEALKIVSIPAVLIYDSKGNLVRTFTDTGKDVGFSYEKDIAPLVMSLLAP